MCHPIPRQKLTLATAALLATLLPTRARAGTTLTWDNDPTQPGAQGGSGTWAHAAGGWFNGTSNVTWNNSDLDSALFAGTTAGTVTLSGTARAQQLTFDTPGYSLAGGTLMLGYFSEPPAIHANADVTIGSDLLPGFGINDWIKDGRGTLTLTGLNYDIATPFHLRAGTLAFSSAINPPATIVFDGDSTSRLRYTGTELNVYTALRVDTVGTFEVANAATVARLPADIRGAGLLVKTGPGTLTPVAQNFDFTGTVRVDAGTLLLDRRDTLLRVLLNGGDDGAATLAMRASFPDMFLPSVSVVGGSNSIVVDNLPGKSSTPGDLGLSHLEVAGGTLSLSAGPGRSLSAWSLTNSGTIDLNNVRLTVNASPVNPAPDAPAGTFRFGHDPSPTPDVKNRGFWVTNAAANTLNATFEGRSDDADLVVGAQGGSSTYRTLLTLDGTWRGGAGGATSTLAVLAYGTITLGPDLRFNNLTADRTTVRPLRAWGGDYTAQLVFDPGFVADHTNGGAEADGLGELQLSGLTWITHDSKSLPIVTRLSPSGATHRAGLITFDNFSRPTNAGSATWSIQTSDQTCDGGVFVKQNGTIGLSKNLTLTGRADRYADNQLRVAPNRTLFVTGPGTLNLSGDLGFAPGSRLSGGTSVLVFNTDPGAGWYDGNYARDPATGAVLAPPAPSHTLKLSVGNLEGRGGAVFNAPVTHLAELSVGGTAVVSLSLPAGPQKVLSVSARLATFSSQYFTYSLDLTDNAMILGAASGQTPDTVRPLLLRGTLRSSAAADDDDHALGYARAADVLALPSSGPRTFLGLPVSADEVLVRYTVLGDATLDGAVDFTDLLTLARNYNTTTNAQWSSGDFNYDGSINFNDLLILARHYNAALPTALVPGAPAAFSADLAAATAEVPEPTAALLTAIAVGGITRTARRKRWTSR